MNSALAVLWSLGIASVLFLCHRLLIALLHLIVIHFGVETTALVIHTQRREKDGDIYLQGSYVFKDAGGHDHTFAFAICVDWPGDDQWRTLLRLYTQGKRNRVRYLPWLPRLHEVQTAV